MKSIGIITIHRINNFGSVLQAFALQESCKALGYNVKIIDYIFPNKFHKLQSLNVLNSTNLFEKAIKYIFGLSLLIQHKKIEVFRKKYFNLTEIYPDYEALLCCCPKFDVYITGSDQVWNKKYCAEDPAFFLEFVPENSKCISYAACFGQNEFDSSYRNKISIYLKKYSKILIREIEGIKLLNTLGLESYLVLDPTFLYDKDQWFSLLNIKNGKCKKYILCYFLNYSFNAFPYVMLLAEYIHKMTGFSIIFIGRPPLTFNKYLFNHKVNVSPQDLVQYIADASIVLTTSFHGTAFAINFSIPFFSIISNDGNDTRISSLLESLDLNDRIIKVSDPFPQKEKLLCDFSTTNMKLNLFREHSKILLKNSIEQV